MNENEKVLLAAGATAVVVWLLMRKKATPALPTKVNLSLRNNQLAVLTIYKEGDQANPIMHQTADIYGPMDVALEPGDYVVNWDLQLA